VVTDDIVTRLRGWSNRMIPTPLIFDEAANEIERLQDSVAEVDKLRQRISELEDRVSDLEQSHG
jgi:ubiquinone biosynthesis protein UbiJ